MVYNSFGKFSFAMPQMENSNMIDQLLWHKRYKSEKWKRYDGALQRERSMSGFLLQLYNRAKVTVTAAAGSSWPQVVAVMSEFNTSLGGGHWSVYSQDYPTVAGVHQSNRDRGDILLLLAHCCSRQQWLFCLCLELHLILL